VGAPRGDRGLGARAAGSAPRRAAVPKPDPRRPAARTRRPGAHRAGPRKPP
jgi:hypothetical protein